MKNKHTQGSWKVSSHIPFNEYSTIITTSGRFSGDFNAIIARAEVSVYIETEQAEANARLIAAAPELLEALQELTQSFGLTKTVIVSKIQQAAFDKSIAAIKKATL